VAPQTPAAPGPAAQTRAQPISVSLTGLWFLGALFLGLVTIYFLGVDQGSVSVTGKGMLLHEIFHDARHTLGFPCH
jgi:Probable cobalt transporter subunit (CbtB)